MKVVLLAGGFGSRISEESQFKPKPMIEIGGMPILWHIMKEYAYYGYNEFIICAGYKQEYIKQWFANYFLYNSDISFDFRGDKNEMTVHHSHLDHWKVTVVDTGYNTMTGGRIKRIQEYVGNDGVPINAGYMVFQPEIFNYLTDDTCIFEHDPLHNLVEDGQLMSYVHEGFWQCMDNVREKEMLENLLKQGKAPWKRWDREVPKHK